jgi:Uncharacterized protein conserved in bacteria (DUF2087)
MSNHDAAALLHELSTLVAKQGVALGGLTPRQRSLTLGLACCQVSAGVPLREADVNLALKQALADTCRFLGVDHVELRRWLVDGGWLVRDGFGREYRRVAPDGLAPEPKAIALAIAGIDPAVWVADVRDAALAQREQRRQAWEARAGKVAP